MQYTIHLNFAGVVMDDRIQALGAAQQLLQSFKKDHPQWADDRLPLEDLARWLDLEIATFHLDDYPGTLGFLEPGENLVWLRRDLPDPLHRFTLAHELGHAVLHRRAGYRRVAFNALPLAQESAQGMSREDPCQTQDMREEAMGLIYQEQAEELLGIGMTYDPRSERELAANIFSAELLMPLERVQALYLDQNITPSTLTSTFDVSNAAMLNRLVGLLSQIGPPTSQTPAEEIQAGQPEIEHPREVPPQKRLYDEFQQAAIEAATPALIVAGPG